MINCIFFGINIYNWEQILFQIIKVYRKLLGVIISPKLSESDKFDETNDSNGLKINLGKIVDKLHKPSNVNSNMKRTQSQNFNFSDDNKIQNEEQILYSYHKSKDFSCTNYSITFLSLSKIIPKHSKSMEHLNELIKNRTHNIRLCCNPECRKTIVGYCFCAYDGYYCSINCRSLASNYISIYWDKV